MSKENKKISKNAARISQNQNDNDGLDNKSINNHNKYKYPRYKTIIH